MCFTQIKVHAFVQTAYQFLILEKQSKQYRLVFLAESWPPIHSSDSSTSKQNQAAQTLLELSVIEDSTTEDDTSSKKGLESKVPAKEDSTSEYDTSSEEEFEQASEKRSRTPLQSTNVRLTEPKVPATSKIPNIVSQETQTVEENYIPEDNYLGLQSSIKMNATGPL